MRSSDLHALLDRPDDVAGLRAAIAEAMPAFRRGRAERGRSAPVLLDTEGSDLLIAQDHIRFLCEEYLAGNLDECEVEYIASALDLCPDFRCASSAVEAAVFRLSTPERPGYLARECITEVLDSLDEARGLTRRCS